MKRGGENELLEAGWQGAASVRVCGCNDFPYTICVAPICKIVDHKSQPSPRGVNLRQMSGWYQV